MEERESHVFGLKEWKKGHVGRGRWVGGDCVFVFFAGKNFNLITIFVLIFSTFIEIFYSFFRSGG